MNEELKRTRAFADLVERRTGIRLEYAAARALHLRLLTLYRLLIRIPPQQRGEADQETGSEVA